MPQFIPGLELGRRLYIELIRPLLDQYFSQLPHTAALIGDGSEVLGFDTEMSMDHNWCPRLQIFLRADDIHLAEPIQEMLSHNLPHTFLDFPLDTIPVADDAGTHIMAIKTDGPVDHQVKVLTVENFFLNHMNWDIHQPLRPADWLSISAQILASVTAGAVYFDNLGELTHVREQLAWYPHDVWLYLMAAGWNRMDAEEPLVSRAGFVGDELGSAIIGARLIRDIMTLCFLIEKQYAPYPKWFGSGFKRLKCSAELTSILQRIFAAKTWQERESALNEAYVFLAKMHNALGITDPLPEQVSNFFGRPFKVVHGNIFAQALLEMITDEEVKRIVRKGVLGSIDQFSDSTELRSNLRWYPAVRKLFD